MIEALAVMGACAVVSVLVTAFIWWSTDSAAEHAMLSAAETVASDPSAPSPLAIDDLLEAARCNCASLVTKARYAPARNAAVAVLPMLSPPDVRGSSSAFSSAPSA